MNDLEKKTANDKLLVLKNNLQMMSKVAVAFSGGVDSTLLLTVAHMVLGNNAIAITALSNVIPVREQEEAKVFCQQRNISQKFFDYNEMQVPGFSENNADRCYHCKKALITGIKRLAEVEGCYTLVEGSNVDDLHDYRPGLRALRELQVTSPLQDAGLNKVEIRYLAYELGLKEWNKPSYACLASRFAYGEAITHSKLKMVEAAEQMLYDLGLRQFRVRVHQNLARIEVMETDMNIIVSNKAMLVNCFKKLGFTYIALDLAGYRSGSMNAEL